MISIVLKPRQIGYVALILLAIVVCVYSFYIDLYPQKSNTDLWTHLAIVNELKADTFSDINAPFYPDGIRDPRGGSYLAAVAIVSKILNISTINTYLFFGIVNVVFFLFAATIFAREFFYSRRTAFIFPILLIFLWGASKNVAAGMFSLNEILWMGPFVHFFALGCTLLVLAFMNRYLRIEKYTRSNYISVLFLSYIVWNSHILSGVFLFVAIATYVLVSFFQKRYPRRKAITLALVPIIVVVINFIWPLYSQVSFFEKQGAAITQTNPTIENISDIDRGTLLRAWISLAGFSLLGFFMLIRKKRYLFFFILFIVATVIILSGLNPNSVRFYWRFFPLLVFSGAVGWAVFLQRLHWRTVSVIIVSLLTIGSAYTSEKMMVFHDWEPYTYDQSYYGGSAIDFGIVKNLPARSVVFTDAIESHIFSGLTGLNVVGVRPQHASFTQTAVQAQGYYDIKLAYTNPETIYSTIEQYGITHFLLKNPPEEGDGDLTEYLISHFRKLNQDNRFILLSTQ